MSKATLPIGRILPPRYKFIVETAFIRRFTWKDRFLIFIGCPVKIELRMLTEHSTGKFEPALSLKAIPQEATK